MVNIQSVEPYYRRRMLECGPACRFLPQEMHLNMQWNCPSALRLLPFPLSDDYHASIRQGTYHGRLSTRSLSLIFAPMKLVSCALAPTLAFFSRDPHYLKYRFHPINYTWSEELEMGTHLAEEVALQVLTAMEDEDTV